MATINSQPVIDATQWAADLILVEKIQPPVGAYNREGGVSLFSQGKVAVLLDEPSRVVPSRTRAALRWDIDLPSGPRWRADDVLDHGPLVDARAQRTEGSGLGADQVPLDGRVLEPVQHPLRLRSRPGRRRRKRREPLLVKNQEFAQTAWDGLVTHPKISRSSTSTRRHSRQPASAVPPWRTH